MKTTNTYNWTTARGAKVSATVTVEHITCKTVSADGFEVEVNCNEWFYQVDGMTVNGKPTELKELCIEGNKRCILIARHGKDRVLAALPADVEEAIYGEERAYKRARMEKNIELGKKLDSEREKILTVMNP